jgi:uncharacterized protein YbbC (DUF1343 family)
MRKSTGWVKLGLQLDLMVGDDWIRRDIEGGVLGAKMHEHWQKGLEQFKRIRGKYLLYQ